MVSGWVPSNGISYPVGIAKQHPYGGGGIPHAYLISPDGMVVWDGHPASLQDNQIENLLRRSSKFYVRKVDAAVRPAAKAFKAGKMAQAESLAKALQGKEGLSRAAIADADHVLARVAKTRGYWKGRVEQGEKDGDYTPVFNALALLKKHFAGGEDATWAAGKEKALKADPAVKKERKAAKQLLKLWAGKQKAGRSEKKLKALLKKVEKFIARNEGTKTAERAKSLTSAIRQTKTR